MPKVSSTSGLVAKLCSLPLLLAFLCQQTLERKTGSASTPQSLGPQCRAPVILPSIGGDDDDFIHHDDSSEAEDRRDSPVFLLETSGRDVLSPRQACAAESAASR